MELLKVTQHKWDRKLLEMVKLWPIRETMAKIRATSSATIRSPYFQGAMEYAYSGDSFSKDPVTFRAQKLGLIQ